VVHLVPELNSCTARGLCFVAVILLAVLAVTGPAVDTAQAAAHLYDDNDRTYSYGRVYNSTSHWLGAEANIEVRSGDLDSDDANAGGFVDETLWIAPTLTTPYWVEVGLARGWEQSDILTFYWVCRNATATGTPPTYYHEHKVWNLNASNYTQQSPVFKIVNVEGTNSWDVYIDGMPADDIEDDNRAGTPFDRINNYDAGLESNCASGKMGTSSNPVNITTMKKKTSSGWSFGPPYDGYDHGYRLIELNPVYGYSGPTAHGYWDVSPGQRTWNYRNN